MKPIWKNKRLTVELHKPDEQVLRKAQAIGEALMAMNQDTGQALVDAIRAILGDEGVDDADSV